MQVLARLSPSLLAHLRFVLAGDHTVVPVDGWDALGGKIRSSPVDVAVVDPQLDESPEALALLSLVERYPSVPFVLYTSLTADSVRATVKLAKQGVRHVVLRGFDDEPHRFRELLERQPAYQMSDRLLDLINRSLEIVPASLARAVQRLFLAPHTFRGVDDLAAAAEMPRRAVDRWLDRVQLAPARTLLIVARVARAYFYMHDPGYQTDDVIRKLGYSYRRFARQIRVVDGALTPSALRNESPDEFMAKLAALLRNREVEVIDAAREPDPCAGS